MYLLCVDNDGFEDQLTLESAYMVEQSGENGYQVYDDKEILRWYGELHFAIIEQTLEG